MMYNFVANSQWRRQDLLRGGTKLESGYEALILQGRDAAAAR